MVSGGGIRQWTKDRKRDYVEGEAGIKRAMGWRRKAVTHYCRLKGKGIGKWWENRIERTEDAACLRCGEEEETSYHIVFWCRKIRRVKDGRRRRE